MLIKGIMFPDMQIGINRKGCCERLIESHWSLFQLKFLLGKLTIILFMVEIMIINSFGYPVIYYSNLEFEYELSIIKWIKEWLIVS